MSTVGAAAILVVGSSFGLFSGTESSGGNDFTAGDVTVGAGSPASVTCSITGMMPGDSSTNAPIGNQSDTACTYNVKYTGSSDAYLAVDVEVSNGETSLYDESGTGLELYLADGAPTTYVTSGAPATGTTYTQEGGTPAALPTGSTDNLLVSTTPATTNDTVDFTLDYALPLTSGNSYADGGATVTLTFHAVQSANNALPADCAAGQQCNADGDRSSFAWS